jgi:hypothetical protein
VRGFDVIPIAAMSDWFELGKQCSQHIYSLVRSLLVMEGRTMNHHVFAVSTYFETKSIVQTQRRFR